MGRPLAEAELVEQAKRGDSAAYEMLVVQHQQMAFRTAYLVTGSAADAEEAAQDAFVKAFGAPGRPNLSLGPLVPDGPGRTLGFFDYFVAPDVSEGWVREFVAFDDQVGSEDRALVERVHRGVTSGVLGEGRLMGESERLIAHFDALVREALA